MKKTMILTGLIAMIAVFSIGCGQSAKEDVDKSAEQTDLQETDAPAAEAAPSETETPTEQTEPQETETPAADAASSETETTDNGDYSKFAGEWYIDGSLENGHYLITADGHVESYSYDDMVNFEGEMKREEYENPDAPKGYLYNIYDEGGEFIIGFYEPEEEDFYELYSGQDGEYHYVRSDHCTGSKK